MNSDEFVELRRPHEVPSPRIGAVRDYCGCINIYTLIFIYDVPYKNNNIYSEWYVIYIFIKFLPT